MYQYCLRGPRLVSGISSSSERPSSDKRALNNITSNRWDSLTESESSRSGLCEKKH